MLNYKWSEGYSVGDATLDGHHQKLLNMFNDVSAMLVTEYNADKMMQLLTQLKDYTIFHFEEEEKRMIANNYPDYDLHLAKHHTFVTQVESSLKKVKANPDEVTDDLFIFLSQWLITHIQQDDMKYKGLI